MKPFIVDNALREGTQKKVPRVLLPMKSSYLVTKDGNTRKAAKRGTRERENKTERKEKKRKEKKRKEKKRKEKKRKKKTGLEINESETR